jgi:hypothetical protein
METSKLSLVSVSEAEAVFEMRNVGPGFCFRCPIDHPDKMVDQEKHVCSSIRRTNARVKLDLRNPEIKRMVGNPAEADISKCKVIGGIRLRRLMGK